MTAPKSPRARRRPCRWCGEPETVHRNPTSRCPGYLPIDPTPSGVHVTPRLDLKIPDPEGHAEWWRALAASEGTSLGDLCRRALDAYAAARPDRYEARGERVRTVFVREAGQ